MALIRFFFKDGGVRDVDPQRVQVYKTIIPPKEGMPYEQGMKCPCDPAFLSYSFMTRQPIRINPENEDSPVEAIPTDNIRTYQMYREGQEPEPLTQTRDASTSRTLSLGGRQLTETPSGLVVPTNRQAQ